MAGIMLHFVLNYKQCALLPSLLNTSRVYDESVAQISDCALQKQITGTVAALLTHNTLV